MSTRDNVCLCVELCVVWDCAVLEGQRDKTVYTGQNITGLTVVQRNTSWQTSLRPKFTWQERKHLLSAHNIHNFCSLSCLDKLEFWSVAYMAYVGPFLFSSVSLSTRSPSSHIRLEHFRFCHWLAPKLETSGCTVTCYIVRSQVLHLTALYRFWLTAVINFSTVRDKKMPPSLLLIGLLLHICYCLSKGTAVP